MSGILDEPQTNNTQSTAPPRKRSRPDSGCEIDSGLGSSDGGSGSGRSVNGGSMDNDENEDSREGGSQKRARSEGHGEPDISRGSVSWSRGLPTHPTPLSSAQTARHYAGRTSTEDSSVDSLIPLPVVPLRNGQWNPEETELDRPGGSNGGSQLHTAREDLARSMEFDQHMDVLRHSPPSISSPPSTAAQAASPELTHEEGPTLEQQELPNSFEESLLDTVAGHEASEPESQVRNEVHRPDSSGRLHTLADTASIHARISRPLGHTARSITPRLPPIDPTITSDLTSSTSSNDSTSFMPRSRLRLFRRPEHLQLRPLSRSPTQQTGPAGAQESHLIGSSAASSSRSGALVEGGTLSTNLYPGEASTTVQVPGPPPSIVSSQTTSLPPEHSPVTNYRRTLGRNDWFQDMHDIFDPFEPFNLDERQERQNSPSRLPPDPAGLEEFTLPALILARRRSDRIAHSQTRAVPVPEVDHFNENEAFRHPRTVIGTEQTRPLTENVILGYNNSPRRLPINPSNGIVDPMESRDAATGRPNEDRPLSGSFWTGIFDETDSERGNSPQLPTSGNNMATDRRSTISLRDSELRRPAQDTYHDNLRHRQPGIERDAASQHTDSLRGIFLDNDRTHLSTWDSPRRPPSLVDGDYIPTTASSSSSTSFSSIRRSSSRSLLDPTLRFGSSSVANPRSAWPSGSEREPDSQLGRPRRGLRPGVSPWSMDEDTDPFDLERVPSGQQGRRPERPYSSFFSSAITSNTQRIRIDDDHTPLSPPSSRRSNSLNRLESSPGLDEPPWPRLLPNRPRAVDRNAAPRHTFRMTSGFDNSFGNAAAAPDPDSSGLWPSHSRGTDPLDVLPRQSRRRDDSPTYPDTRFGPSIRDGLHNPDSVFGVGEQSSPSRLRLRRQLGEAPSPSVDSEQQPESMEDIIPESNARSGMSSRIDPPPRPVEPRLSSLDVGPRPSARLLPRRFRPPSPSLFSSLMRQDNDSPDAIHSTSAAPARPQRSADAPHQPLFGWHGWHRESGAEQTPADRRMPSGHENGSQSPNFPSRLDAAMDQRRRDLSSWSRPPRSNVGPLMRGASETLTFSELVRRRTDWVDEQARAARRSPSPDATTGPTYRLPRPSSIFDEAETVRSRENATRFERRQNTTVLGLGSSSGSGRRGLDEETVRRGREHAREQNDRLPYLRAIPSSRGTNEGHSESHDYLTDVRSDRGRSFNWFWRTHDADAVTNESPAHATTLERQGRQAFASGPPSLGTHVPGNSFAETEDDNGARERERVRNAIRRRTRDDDVATRQGLPRLDRARNIMSRDLMSDETTRNLQRRLRESEVEESRALQALDRWGELEGSGERELDPTQSRMHRFGEMSRRRRVPPAFHFGSSAMESDSFSGSGAGSSSTARQGRRSPSPASAAARLQARQARFARVQGRFRDAADMFGEAAGRRGFASRLDMLGGSRLPSRFLSRSLGDYMRDEDFDASYENLVRLAAAVGDAKPRGTPAHLLAAMPTGFYKDFAAPGCETRCPICLDDYKELDPVLRISDCDHWFHKECLEQWLQGARSCPLCKGVVRGRARGQKPPPDDAPGPSGSRRDSGSDDEGPSGVPTGGPGRSGSPGLTLEELGSYAAGW